MMSSAPWKTAPATGPNRYHIVTAKDGFHGRTFGAMSATCLLYTSDTGVIVPGMCLSIIWFVFVTVLFLKWFERREVK